VWDRFDEVLTRWNGCDRAEPLRRRVAAFAVDLADYQDRAYAERYLHTLEPLARAEAEATPHSTAVTEAAARELYRLMAYKDEYEVARLLLRGPWRRWLERRHEGRVELLYHLHPPLLRALGLRRKLALGRSVEPLLAALARMKRLRGTPLDPFGLTRARKVERELARWYPTVLADLAAALTPGNAVLALEVASAPEALRGFEDVKLSRVDAVGAAVREKLARLRGD
jgi:indolepyruvate ferredoxin oxidoreductase